jgi:ubiquinone/menaquinone biosynthesis C-methylase UbiE
MESERVPLTPEEVARQNENYRTHENVRARFEVYKLMEPYINVESLAIDVLGLNGQETIVDVGTGDGSFLWRLRAEKGHHGRLVGIEPNTKQFETAAIWQSAESPNINPEIDPVDNFIQKYVASGIFSKIAGAESPISVELYKGDAENIPLDDDLADVLCAMFMLYHIPTNEQPAAIEEFKRVLKPDGVMVATTSSSYNKCLHRELENDIAEDLGIKRPLIMNSQYTTEIARLDLPLFFDHVYEYVFDSVIGIHDKDDAEIYLNSIRSLRDQFVPKPDDNVFEEALQKAAVPVITDQIKQHGRALDFASRSIFICSDRPLQLMDNRFKDISYVEG